MNKEEVKIDNPMEEFKTKEETIETKTEACELKKKEGNEFFKKEEYEKAIESYERTLNYLPILFNKEEENIDEITKNIKIQCFANILMCKIKQQKYQEGIEISDKILKLDENNAKSIYRRGLCFEKINELEKAEQCYLKLSNLENSNHHFSSTETLLFSKMNNTNKFARTSALFDDTADIINEEAPEVEMNFFETPTSGQYSTNDFSNETNNFNNNFSNNQNQSSSFFSSNNFSTGNQATDFLIGAGMDKLYGTGNEMISTGVGQYVSYFEGFKPYFNVDNEYVFKRLKLIFFPFTTKEIEGIDLYIPFMSFITWVLIVAFSFGAKNKFSPDILWNISIRGSFTILFEVLFIKFGLYLLAGQSNTTLTLMEIFAFCGYKYVSIVFCLIISIFFGNKFYFISTIFTSISMMIFLIKAMRRRTLFHGNQAISDSYKSYRVYFLFIVALLQIPISFWLSYPYSYNYSEK
eukprot:gene1035-9939_t